MANTIFITGATGNIGGKIVGHILEQNNSDRIILLVRAESIPEARKRLDNVMRKTSPHLNMSDFADRIEIICGDITDRLLGVDYDHLENIAVRVTHIIHAAAATKFDQPLDEAQRVNLQGTKNIMHFAEMAYKTGRLSRMSYISTAYVCGERKGVIYEDEPDTGSSFSNSYEQSKWEAEKYVRSFSPRLPVMIFRPAIVVGDSTTGRISLFNVLYTPLRFVCRGDLPVLPCRPETVLDVVPVDYAARAICHISLCTPIGQNIIYHITAGVDNGFTVKDIVDQAIAFVNRTIPGLNITAPKYAGARLLRAAGRFLPGRAGKLIKLIEVYEPYISAGRSFDCRNTLAALEGSGITIPKPADYFDNVLAYWIKAAHVMSLRRAA